MITITRQVGIETDYGHHISGYQLRVCQFSIGSKPADKLVPRHFHSHHREDSSWEERGMILREVVELLQVSRHRGLSADSSHHTWAVANGMWGLQLGIDHVRVTAHMQELQGKRRRMHWPDDQLWREA